MQACVKRLNNERAQLAKTNDDSIFLSVPNNENIRAWQALIKGPPGSFYEGYEFNLGISVPEQYPMLPPQIKFISKIFHPNVLFEVFLLFKTVSIIYIIPHVPMMHYASPEKSA